MRYPFQATRLGGDVAAPSKCAKNCRALSPNPDAISRVSVKSGWAQTSWKSCEEEPGAPLELPSALLCENPTQIPSHRWFLSASASPAGNIPRHGRDARGGTPGPCLRGLGVAPPHVHAGALRAARAHQRHGSRCRRAVADVTGRHAQHVAHWGTAGDDARPPAASRAARVQVDARAESGAERHVGCHLRRGQFAAAPDRRAVLAGANRPCDADAGGRGRGHVPRCLSALPDVRQPRVSSRWRLAAWAGGGRSDSRRRPGWAARAGARGQCGVRRARRMAGIAHGGVWHRLHRQPLGPDDVRRGPARQRLQPDPRRRVALGALRAARHDDRRGPGGAGPGRHRPARARSGHGAREHAPGGGRGPSWHARVGRKRVRRDCRRTRARGRPGHRPVAGPARGVRDLRGRRGVCA